MSKDRMDRAALRAASKIAKALPMSDIKETTVAIFIRDEYAGLIEAADDLANGDDFGITQNHLRLERLRDELRKIQGER